MEGAAASQYWCHMCSQTVNPVMETDSIKCPRCYSGFVEEMASAAPAAGNGSPLYIDPGRAVSLWAPILLSMMANSTRRHRVRRIEYQHDDNADMDNHQAASIIRRRRGSAAILQLLHGIRAGLAPESGGSETRDRDRERVILINPFNQTIIVQGSYDPTNGSQNHAPVGSLGDYYIGPGLDLLMQYLSENDSNRYGTPPAQKEAVEALASVEIKDPLYCCVCLDECEIGSQMMEMPCKHKFHSGCISPWLELHSSCPICRYQLPYDEPKLGSERSRNNNNDNTNGGSGRNGSGRQFSVPLPWPLSSLFPSTPTISEPSRNGPSATLLEEEDD